MTGLPRFTDVPLQQIANQGLSSCPEWHQVPALPSESQKASMTAHSLEQDPEPAAPAAPSSSSLMRNLFSLLGEKWTLVVLTALRTERRRFSELKREIPGVSQRMLAQTLRELERAHFVDRIVLSTTPPRVEYVITDLGKGLFPHLRAMKEWATLHEDQMFGAPPASG